jgi:hypothetical protein
MGRLQDKIAIVTGGASGIGRGCSIALAAEGARVIVADVDQKGASETCGSIVAEGGRAFARPLDVARSRVRERIMTGDSKGEYRGLAYRNDADLKAWLAKRPGEAALEPDLPIIDPHHHFWDTPQRGCYLLPELLADIGGGHNIVATVFLECQAMYREAGPAAQNP